MEEKCNLLVAGDLHLGQGLDVKSGRYSRLEDFLFDGAFARFLRYHEQIKHQPRFGGRPWRLIFNGDLFDFVQVVSLPEEGQDLLAVKGVARHGDLSADERRYGLGSTARESAWKMGRIARGHARFFAALGWFIAQGNQVAIVTGNHDIELYWPAVQARLVAEIERAYGRQRARTGAGAPVSLAEIEARVRFYPWFYYEPQRVYVEHGGQYESSCHFPDFLTPVSLADPEHIQPVWGELFGRYMFNQVEDVHPFADNVKPPPRYLWWAMRRAPLMTVRLILIRGWVFLYTFWKVTRTALEKKRQQATPQQSDQLSLPSHVMQELIALAKTWSGGSRQEWFGMLIMGVLTVAGLALLVLAVISLIRTRWGVGAAWLAGSLLVYLVQKFLAPRLPSFDDFMLRVSRDLEKTLAPTCPVSYIVLGHDHMAAMEKLERAWYINAGTWVQVFDKQGPIEGRERLTFFRLAWGYEGLPELLRWNEAAGQPERLKFGLMD